MVVSYSQIDTQNTWVSMLVSISFTKWFSDTFTTTSKRPIVMVIFTPGFATDTKVLYERNKNLESQCSGKKKTLQVMLLSRLSMFHVHKKISIDKCIIWVWVILATERVISNNPVPYCIWPTFGFLGFP